MLFTQNLNCEAHFRREFYCAFCQWTISTSWYAKCFHNICEWRHFPAFFYSVFWAVSTFPFFLNRNAVVFAHHVDLFNYVLSNLALLLNKTNIMQKFTNLLLTCNIQMGNTRKNFIFTVWLISENWRLQLKLHLLLYLKFELNIVGHN